MANDNDELTASHREYPEGNVSAGELRDLIDSWEWMRDAQADFSDEEARAFSNGYKYALEHAIADLRRTISNNE